MPKITNIMAQQILDSNGIPTVEATVNLDNGVSGSSSVPAGTKTGKYEALEVRDGDPSRYFGMEVTRAINNINSVISPKLVGLDPSKQLDIDQALLSLDNTSNKSTLGVNSLLAVSQASCIAGANLYNMPVFDYLAKKYQLANPQNQWPISFFNLINGGIHGAGNLDFQEFLIIPTSTKPYPESLRMAVEIYHSLESALTQMNAIHSVGTEGGFAPNLFTNKDALEIIIESIRRTDYIFGKDVFLGLDVASNHFFSDGRYTIKDKPKPVEPEELISYFKDLNTSISLFSLEDPIIEDDWKSWVQLTKELSNNTVIIGDDLIASNIQRLEKAITEKACTAIVIKPNQIGTVSQTVQLVQKAKSAGIDVVISQRSGETNDSFIADLAVGIGANYTKFGAPSRGERVAKYNRLLNIYQLINQSNMAVNRAVVN